MTTLDPRIASRRPQPAPTFGVRFWREALAEPAIHGVGPYGPLGQPDIYGLRLPAGFRARLIGRTSRTVAGTDYTWHPEPDDAATFRMRDGGWAYVSNSDVPGDQGGAGAIRFNADGQIVDAYRVLDGTTDNRAGGATPWGTWLSAEGFAQGRVWECDPAKPGRGQVRPFLGAFAHGRLAVDPRSGWVYLTEDAADGRVYRFRPDAYGDLSIGTLDAAKVRRSGHVDWVEVSTKHPERSPRTTGFARVADCWFGDGQLFLTTDAAQRVWVIDVASNSVEQVYDADAIGVDAPFHYAVAVTVHERSGDIYTTEVGADPQLVLLADARRRRIAAPFLQLAGHSGSEVVGAVFSPDGTRLFVSSKCGLDAEGLTFDVTGPFRRQR
ncbi:MAG: alkaline phosphatase PhoX [Actinomycetes bacterium]